MKQGRLMRYLADKVRSQEQMGAATRQAYGDMLNVMLGVRPGKLDEVEAYAKEYRAALDDFIAHIGDNTQGPPLEDLVLELFGLATSAIPHFGHYDKAWDTHYQQLEKRVQKIIQDAYERRDNALL